MSGVYRARYDGFQAALQEVGVKDTEDNILTLLPNHNEFEGSLQNVYKRMNEFTALFCVSDYYAMRIMNYLMDRGVKIPENISITGFDDNMIGQSVRPALTTMRQNPTQKGYIAVEQLIKVIEGNEVTEKNILLTTELIIRNTVKKIN
jgi:LacI family transcriptional regulator